MTVPLAMVDLDAVAADAVDLVRAFRANGSVSFQDLPLEQSRTAYVAACRANGLPPVEVGRVETRPCPVQGADISIRLYRPSGSTADVRLPLVLFIHGGGWALGDLENPRPHLPPHLRGDADGGWPPSTIAGHRSIRFLFLWRTASRRLRGWRYRHQSCGSTSPGRSCSATAPEAAWLPIWRGKRQDCPAPMVVRGQVLLYPVTDLSAEAGSYTRLPRISAVGRLDALVLGPVSPPGNGQVRSEAVAAAHGRAKTASPLPGFGGARPAL